MLGFDERVYLIYYAYFQNLTLENGDHGALVQQILDTKKELEDGNTKPKNKGVEIERESGISDFNRQRERESTQREIQKLKDSIQVNKTRVFLNYLTYL